MGAASARHPRAALHRETGHAPDAEVVRAAVDALRASGEALAGFGIDFGVLASGETALVEMNDGFSLGSYGLEDALYTDLVVARWCEITGVNPS